MPEILSFLFIFIIALLIGFFVGKMIFGSKFLSEKTSLSDKILVLENQLIQEKSIFENEKLNIQKQFSSFRTEIEKLHADKDILRNEKEA
ncbi:MAG: hypothetical protein RLZZ312_1248, partial [Bacteroidota bacterium]